MEVRVDVENTVEVATEIVRLLKGKSFSVASFFSNIYPAPLPKVLPDVRLYDGPPIPGFDPEVGFVYENGMVTIPMSPRRKLFWDLWNEEVVVVFEDGYFFIQRHLPNGVLCRLVIVSQ